jgi:transcriptional regulator PpsR
VVHLGMGREAWIARATLMTSDPGPLFMVQLARAGGAPVIQGPREEISFDDFIDRLPDAFVVMDRGGVVRRVNRAFLDLVQAGAEGAVIGERLGRWLSQPGADLSALMANLNRHGSVRLFATTIHGDLGAETNVEISAAGTASGRSNHVALLMRDVSRRMVPSDAVSGLQSALASVIEQSGKTSLRVLIKEAVGLVERHYIEAALDLAQGNRTAAAEILGLSRQGFYKKLAQYEMEGHARPAVDAED